MEKRALPTDYEEDPGRFSAWRPSRDVHGAVATRIRSEKLAPLLDLGCGPGRLAEAVATVDTWIGLDRSPTMLRDAPRPVVLAEATEIPVASGSVGAVAALWMLYHLDDPTAALREARRVLRSGGLFVASASRRDDSPELCSPTDPSTFDAEEAPDIVAAVFRDVEVDAWDAPLVELVDRDQVRAFLVQQMGDPAIADQVDPPVAVTKRGCLVWARKP